jgi:pyridinium-3,5-bisthiocarboxylic acid mononucleotide nickel chelatase
MLIMVNVDNITGELIPYIIEGLLTRGAQNVHAVPAITKKGRWAYLFYVDVPEKMIEQVGDYLVSELGTIGFRVFNDRHVTYEYKVVPVHVIAREKKTGQELLRKSIRVKLIQSHKGTLASVSAEYEDVRACVLQLQQMGFNTSFSFLKETIEYSVAEKQGNGYSISMEL